MIFNNVYLLRHQRLSGLHRLTRSGSLSYSSLICVVINYDQYPDAYSSFRVFLCFPFFIVFCQIFMLFIIKHSNTRLLFPAFAGFAPSFCFLESEDKDQRIKTDKD